MSSTNPTEHLLLLSRDLRSDGRDLQSDGQEPTDESAVEQLALPGIERPPVRKPRRRTRSADEHPGQVAADDPLLTAFVRRLAAQGRARKGCKAYEYQIRSMLIIAARRSGRLMTCTDL